MTSLGARARACVVAIAGGIWAACAWAAPTTLLTVGGKEDASQYIDRGQAAAVAFTLDRAYSKVSISASLFCVGCKGEVILMEGRIGPTATLAHFVTGDFFDVDSEVDPLLQGLDLPAGTYYLIVAMTESAGTGWTGSEQPVITSVPGVSTGFDFFASTLDSILFKSDFDVVLSTRGLHFSVTADVAPQGVPLPPTLWNAAAALALLGWIGRARRQPLRR